MKGFLATIGILAILLVGIPLIRIAFFPTYVVNQAVTVAQRIGSADNMLGQYKWFHDADASLKVFPSQIAAARRNLKAAESRKSVMTDARETELTGIIQVCESLVGQYNSRAQRIDAGFFRNPERWLPVATAPWEALPQGYTPDWCSGE